MATCTITTVTDPISSVNQTAVTASGTCTASDAVTVTIRDQTGTAVGPVAATEVGTAWSIAATDITDLADGTLIFEATSTSVGDEAFAAKAAYKNTASTLYVTIAEFRDYIHDASVLDSGSASRAIAAACREVDAICGRVFYQTTAVRYFWPDNQGETCIDDLATASGLAVAVDSAGDGTYAQSWAVTTDFFLEPINQIQDGIAGWPYTKLAATFATNYFPIRYTSSIVHPTVKVTGTWGWAAVPDPVKQATLVIAAQLYKMGDAPFGTAGFGEFGVLRVREIPIVQQLLGPYSKTAGVVVA